MRLPWGLDFLSLTPIGLPVLILGMLYMMLARRLLASDAPSANEAEARPRLASWVERYGLAEREVRARVPAGSAAEGSTLADLGLTPEQGWRVIALERERSHGGCVIGPGADTELRAGDVLLVDGARTLKAIDAVCAKLGLEPLPLSGLYFTDRAQSIGMAEVMLPADSRLLGKTLTEAGVQLERGLAAIGLRRGTAVLDAEALREVGLRAGDTLLLVGAWSAIEQLRGQDHDLVTTSLPKELDEILPAGARAPYAVLALAVTVGLMVSELLPAMHAALVGVLLMLLFRCIDLDNAYRAVSLRTLVLIAGMLPFGMALERTGGIELATEGLIHLLGSASPTLMLGVVFLMTLLLGLFVVPAANAVLMAPLAMALAGDIGASPYPFAIAVALAASSAFMTPVVPANAMVATLGGYRFGDYARMGLPMVGLVMVLTLTLVPWLYPFY